jgi:type II secretory pathway component PulF
MLRYQYRARNEQGELVVGTLNVSHPDGVREELKRKNLYLISAKPQSKAYSFLEKGTVSNLVFFSKQFEVLASTGLPVDRILEIIAQQATQKHFKETLMAVRDSVVSGMQLSAAFREHPKYFNEIFIAIVASTESDIGLATAMSEISTILSQEHELNEKLSVAGLYFKVVSGICIAGLILASIYIFPILKKQRQASSFLALCKFAYQSWGRCVLNMPMHLSLVCSRFV